jgi:hypothetical protein
MWDTGAGAVEVFASLVHEEVLRISWVQPPSESSNPHGNLKT